MSGDSNISIDARPDQSIPFMLGQHSARLGAIEEDMKSQNMKLDTLLERTSQARGGFKMLLAVGGAAATIGALITGVFEAFRHP